MKRQNKKIGTRLGVAFIILITISSTVTGIIYINIFYQSHMRAKIESLLAYANQMQATYGKSTDQEIIDLYDQLLDARIWAIYKGQLPSISKGHHQSEMHQKCKGKNKQCQVKGYDTALVEEVISGKEVISKSNNVFYYGKTLTVGVPIKQNQEVIGAILIHAPLEEVYEPIIRAAFYLCIGAIISIALTMIMAWRYAKDFTKPILEMKQVAKRLMKGDYQARTHIERIDEIGELSYAIDALAIRLEEARLEGEKLEQIRKDFVANVSHEFRTPLTIIRGNTEALIDGASFKPEESYRNIMKETLILERLVTDLLDLARLQQGKINLNLEEISVHEVIRDAIRSMRQVAATKEINMALDLEPYPKPILGDYLRLRQVIMILLDNSVKYTPNGGAIKVSLKINEKIMHVTIEDNGIGIPKEELEWIWDRFYKVDKAREESQSSGIGLAIAKSLLDLLKIEVGLTSEVGKGTSITLFIPIE